MVNKKIVKKKRPERLGRISFKYVEGVRVSKEREILFRGNLNMWLSPYINEINKEKVKIIVTFLDEVKQQFSFDGISFDLKKRAIQHFWGHRTHEPY